MKKKILIWDFDGTLGHREGRHWRNVLLEVLDRYMPGHPFDAEQLAPFLRSGFPWHAPEQPHTHITGADQWWAELEPVFVHAFEGIGVDAERSRWLAGQVREVYCNPIRFRLFEDVFPTLDALSARGWTHVILSNHVPEFNEIAARLSLTERMAAVFNSAWMGYEKPHPEIFRQVLRTIGDDGPRWMIGDSYSADVCGAASVGIPAVLVRRPHTGALLFSPDLTGVIEIVENGKG
ncbi:MAG: HAD family hydrolase [Anaerolineae bacterium]